MCVLVEFGCFCFNFDMCSENDITMIRRFNIFSSRPLLERFMREKKLMLYSL